MTDLAMHADVMSLVRQYALARIMENASVPTKNQRDSELCVAWHERARRESARLEAEISGALATLRGEVEAIRSSGVDPRLLRWCSWPGCLASFDASAGPAGGGWMQYRHMAVLLCPDHKSTGHWPSYDMDRDDLSKLLARCSCGETAEVRPSNWEAVFAWWQQHLADRGLAGRS